MVPICIIGSGFFIILVYVLRGVLLLIIEEVRLDGTHGTCRSRAEKIRRIGFRTGQGRRGYGVYFWKGRYARMLAIGWYNRAFDQKRYLGEHNIKCAVIYATIVSDKRTILDLESPTIKDNLEALAFKHNIDADGTQEYKHLLGRYIDELEQTLAIEYRVILSTVAAPGKDFCKYPLGSLGSPYCIIVREVSCININNVESVEDTNV
jgi:hypothetical protein